MSSQKAILGLCLIFFLGIVTGIALSIRFTDYRIWQLTTGGPEVMAEVVERRLGRELDLTPDQRGQLRAVAKEALESMEMSVGSRPIFPEWLEKDALVAKIRAMLTPGQVAKFDEILAKNPSKAVIGKPIFKIDRKER